MKWVRGVPYVYNVPDLQVEAAGQMGFARSKLLLRVAFWFEGLCLRKSWKVSTVTHRFIEYFQGRGLPRSQVTFLPNGADTEFLRARPASQALLDRWGLGGKKVFAYVGTHAFYHGLDTLVEAAALLRDRRDIAFLLVGDGPERLRLKELARERGATNIVFGESPYEEMDQLYSIAYASVATLRKMDVAKGMRLSKVFPSLSCGVPVIYAGDGEAAELLASNQCGVVVTPENPPRLAQAIVELASNNSSRDEMARRGRTLVETDYSWSAIVRAWLQEIGYLRSGPPSEPLYRGSEVPHYGGS